MTVRYSSKEFRDETIARLTAAYHEALTQLIAHCAARATPVASAMLFIV